jgi:penicillin-binding protein 1A
VHHPRSSVDTIEDYYVRQVENQLLDQPNSPLGSSYTERYNALFEGGLKIYTNLDPRLQALATQTVAADTPANSRGFKQAMVVIDPSTGNVRAMVGGSGFNNSQYDVVTDGTRQPGSGFKLMTLLAALAAGYSPFDTLDAHAPCAINFPGDSYYVTHPANNDEGPGSGGVMTIVQATAQSMNCGYLRLAHEVGLPAIINMANSVGITTLLNPFPSMVLGAEAVHPIDLAAAYAAVADNGVYHPPTFIDHVVDGTGQTIYRGESPGHRVFSQQVASEATLCLQAVVTSGTGYAAGLPGRPVAGKTGTTTKSVDAWFNGFTPQLETTVWMGSPTFEIPMYGVGGVYEVYGGTFPAHTWHNFMEQALAPEPVLYFVPLDPYLLPATKYITSPSLVRDDHSDHNFYVPPTTTTTSTTQPSQTPTTTANSGPTPSTPPGSSPPTTAGGDGHGHGGN